MINEPGYECAVSAHDSVLLGWLLEQIEDDAPNVLSTLTGLPFSQSCPPDFLAVRSGTDVSGKLWGGFTSAGWVDQEGTSVSWFGAGTRPHAYVGVAVAYGVDSGPMKRRRVREIAMTHLLKSLLPESEPSNRQQFPASQVRL